MIFNEANSVRDYIRDLLVDGGIPFVPGSQLPRKTGDVLLESQVRAALIRLNPEIAANPAFADEVLYRLNAIILAGRQSPNPVVDNEVFAEWLTGQKSMPFGPGGTHTTVRLIDFNDPAANEWTISTEVTYITGAIERRFDLVLWCNGFPLVVGEAKTPVRPAYSWIDAAAQINEDYEHNVPAFFVPNVFSFATEGKDFRYGSVGMPVELWGPWRDEQDGSSPMPFGLAAVREAVEGVLNPATVLEFLRFFTLFATDSKHRKIKVIARFQQYQATNLIVERVKQGRIRQGLIWHFQGSGKSLLMVFTALKLRADTSGLRSPTVMIVVDRIDLDTQITGTFNASDVPNLVTANSRRELQELLTTGARKVIITTVHKFGEASGVLDARSNIVLLVDEAHRSQEGEHGRKMREALPNAFLFGLTGTPINKRDRNTFKWFGSEEDDGGYLSRYSFQDSIRDGATLPLHFEPRLSEIHLDEAAIDAAFDELADEYDLTETDRASLTKNAASLEALIRAPERIRMVAADIAHHFQTKVEPEGLKAQIVVYDKRTCVAYKNELDKHLGPDVSTVVMSRDQGDPVEWRPFSPDREELERLTERFKDPADPLKIIIVTAKLLTGFDAPILYAQYLDKPLREHNLLQAITRTNRVYPPHKTHGLIIDYLGIFDDVAKAFEFDDLSVQQLIRNISYLSEQLAPAMAEALAFFPGIDRTVGGYAGLVAAQSAIASEEDKDAFGKAYSIVSQLWETLSPDPILMQYEADYRWLTDVYSSVKSEDIAGRLVWHTLGAKTLALINRHVTVEVPRTDLETIVLDAQVVEDLMSGRKQDIDPEAVEKLITARIARHAGDPVFIELSKRLMALRERYSHAQQASLEFLKELFELARDTVAAENDTEELPREAKGKAALTELFESLRSDETPIIVSNVVNEVDEVVRAVRFEGWQGTRDGDREVQQALRKTLYIKFKIRDNDVFERALGYVREYY